MQLAEEPPSRRAAGEERSHPAAAPQLGDSAVTGGAVVQRKSYFSFKSAASASRLYCGSFASVCTPLTTSSNVARAFAFSPTSR